MKKLFACLCLNRAEFVDGIPQSNETLLSLFVGEGHEYHYDTKEHLMWSLEYAIKTLLMELRVFVYFLLPLPIFYTFSPSWILIIHYKRWLFSFFLFYINNVVFNYVFLLLLLQDSLVSLHTLIISYSLRDVFPFLFIL